jgi:predicted ester cyclase
MVNLPATMTRPGKGERVTTPREIIDRALAAYDTGDLDAYAACFAEDAVTTMNADPPIEGRDAIGKQARMEKAAFPDLTVDRSHFVAEGDWVAWRWRIRGTHDGDYGSLAATHRKFDLRGATHARVVDDRIVELLMLLDRASMFAQLGLR